MNHSFEQVILPLADQLLAFCNYLCRNDADADDLCQNTLLKSFSSFESFGQGTNAKAWLFTIARNTFINEMRRTKRIGQTLEINEVIGLQNPDNGTSLFASGDLSFDTFKDVLSDEVYNALDCMPEDRRILIILAYIFDFQYEELAKMYNIPVGTVRSRIHRGKQELFESLKPFVDSKGFTKN